MKTFLSIAFSILCLSTSLGAHSSQLNTTKIPESTYANIHELNTMLAFGAIDFCLTTIATGSFYFLNGRKLCAFGKSQAIPLANSAALLVSASVARATFDPAWIRTAGIFSSAQGTINVFRSYLGIWYHFIGGQPLPFLAERHEGFELIEGAPEIHFSLGRFLSFAHHREVTREIFYNFIIQDGNRRASLLMGSFLLGIPIIVFASGTVQLAVGIFSAI